MSGITDPSHDLGPDWGVWHPESDIERQKLGPSSLIVDGRVVREIPARDVEAYRAMSRANRDRNVALNSEIFHRGVRFQGDLPRYHTEVDRLRTIVDQRRAEGKQRQAAFERRCAEVAHRRAKADERRRRLRAKASRLTGVMLER